MSKRRLIPYAGAGREVGGGDIGASCREMSASYQAAGLVEMSARNSGLTGKEILALLRDVPEDTRSLTGRLLGDPLPGRSALDARQQA